MRRGLFPGFAALVLGATLATAQTVHSPAGADGTAGVSVDVLRHPITGKLRQMLLSAIQSMDSGDHAAAIGQLQKTLAKYPDSAPYVDNLLGVEFVKTDRFEDAVHSFEQAAALLPHDSMTHYNFGLALVCAGDEDRAMQEFRRASQLDPANTQARMKLDELMERRKRAAN